MTDQTQQPSSDNVDQIAESTEKEQQTKRVKLGMLNLSVSIKLISKKSL